MSDPIDFTRRRKERDDELLSGRLPLETYFGRTIADRAGRMKVQDVVAAYLGDSGIGASGILMILEIDPDALVEDLNQLQRMQLTEGIEGSMRIDEDRDR